MYVCVCGVFLCVRKSRSKKHIEGDGGGGCTPPFSTVVLHGKKEEEIVIYHDSCLVCCLAKSFYVRKNVRHYLGSILRQNQTFSAKKHFDLINN